MQTVSFSKLSPGNLVFRSLRLPKCSMIKRYGFPGCE